MRAPLLLLTAAAAACSSPPGPTDAGSDAGSAGCALTEATTATATVTNGCTLLERDVSACEGQRADAGLGGFWLKFSCRVSLSVTGTGVRVQSDGRPDYKSPYYAATDACFTANTGATMLNPNRIATRSLSMTVPQQPDLISAAMPLGTVGVAVNGVPIFSNVAAPGDDIYTEVGTFDVCGAHPAPGGVYHYHGEPYALSSADSRFIGVLRDGYPVYGRFDADGGLPLLDAFGGHAGTTPDSPAAPVYHYHLNEQTSTAAGTAGQKQWFLTTGTYRGAPGVCTGC